ncbi:MAG: hypothetical protein K8R02_01330 [Anaerohalosphaeraceae bacterium]|nr:hypothetical protein [Anaerohalosphaeraceae bacterium]
MKKTFVNIVLVSLFVFVALTAIGCHGLGETSDERSLDHSRQNNLRNQMLVDDIDAIFYKDRTTRLTEYTVR